MNVKPYVTCLCVCVWLILCYLFSACFQAHENQIKCTMHRHTRRVEIKQYTDYWILYAEYTSSIGHDKINASKYIYSSRSWIVLYFSFALLFRIDVIFWEAWNSNISNEITKNHEKKYLIHEHRCFFHPKTYWHCILICKFIGIKCLIINLWKGWARKKLH